MNIGTQPVSIIKELDLKNVTTNDSTRVQTIMDTVIMGGDTVILDDTDLRVIAEYTCPIIDVIDLTKESPRIRSSRSRSGERLFEDLSVNHSTSEDSSYYCVCTSMRPLASETTQNTQMKESTTRMHRDTNADEAETIDDTVEEKQYTIMSDSRTRVLLMCPICFEALSSNLKPTTTRCGHIFCAECLRTYLRTSKKCPTCKATVTLKSCTRLYF